MIDLTTLSPLAAFALLLGALLSWMFLPLIPAMMELIRPQDATPLNAVGNDAGRLTYFADSFTQFATREGLLGMTVPARLSDGTRVRAHAHDARLAASNQPVTDLVVLFDSEPLPENTVLERECVARRSTRGSAGVTYRALLGQEDVLLGHNSTILRWVHARGRLVAETGTRLNGRATADGSITLAADVSFDRLESGVVRVSGNVAQEPPASATVTRRAFVPQPAVSMGPNYWRVTGDLTIPAGAELTGSVIATGSIFVREGACVNGSMKAHREIRIEKGVVVSGSCTARGRIDIGAGSRVSGPVISETDIYVHSALVGAAGKLTTVTAPVVRLMPGATVYGAIMAADSGLTVGSAP